MPAKAVLVYAKDYDCAFILACQYFGNPWKSSLYKTVHFGTLIYRFSQA